MSNDKRKQAKKKQRERDIQHRKHSEQQRALRQAKLDEYPTVRLGEQDADPEFVNAVLEAAKKIDFLDVNTLGAGYQAFLKCGKEYGFRDAFTLLQGLPDINYGITRVTGIPKLTVAILLYGGLLLQKVPEDIRRRHMPVNDVTVWYEGRDIVLRFTSIRSQSGQGGRVYYNPAEPKIVFDGKEYKVGFSRHSIERICQRLNPKYLEYGNCGDIHAYFRTCVYFEPVSLYRDQLGFAIYNMCYFPGFVHHRIYAQKIFGLENEVPGMGKLYYKVGYCTVAIEGEFAKATTFLPPGYRSTPEYGLLIDSDLPREKKDEWIAKATDESWSELNNFLQDDTEITKWFHQNGIPQVKQIKETVFIDKHPIVPSI
jgi:hypothetical protein